MSNLLNQEVEPIVDDVVEPIVEDKPIDDGPKLSFPDGWKDLLSDDFKNDPSLEPIKDANDLVKSFINAQRMIGADKFTLPSKHDDGTELRGILNKLGLPTEVDKYEINGSEEHKEFLDSFKAKAHELGVLPQQAQGIFDHINETITAANEAEEKEMTEAALAEQEALKQEWGQGFSAKIGMANKAIDHLAGEDNELKEYLRSPAIGGDPKLVKLFAQVGEMLKDDNVISDSNNKWGKSPEEAGREITNIMGNPNHPYNNAEHPGHMAAVEEVQKLTQMTI